MLRRRILHIVFGTSLFVCSASFAQSVSTVLGPETFRATVKGTDLSRSFKAKSNSDGTMVLVNGNGQNLNQQICTGNLVAKLLCSVKNLAIALEVALLRPQSVEIILNGKKVISSANFQSETGTFQVPIKTLIGTPANAVTNQLQIKVKGSPLAEIRLEVKIQSNPAQNLIPTARFSFNPNNALAPAIVTLNGLASQDLDGQIVSYNWNFGDGTTATGSIVSHNFIAAGTYNVRLTVTDNLGAQGTLTQLVTLISDVTPPSLSSISQRVVVTSLPSNISVSLSASEQLSSASVNGSRLSINGNLAVGTLLVSQDGSQNLQIELRDMAGNVANLSRQIEIVLDNAPPVITFNLPPVLITNLNRVTIPITITDSSQVITTLSLNGNQILTTGSKQFTYDLDLVADGEYMLSISSQDEVGRVTTINPVRIRRDTLRPIFSNVLPIEGEVLNSRLVEISGSVNEPSNISVNGVPATMIGNSFVAQVRATKDGIFPIVIQATDLANNQTEIVSNVRIDTGSDRLWTYEECPVNGGGL